MRFRRSAFTSRSQRGLRGSVEQVKIDDAQADPLASLRAMVGVERGNERLSRNAAVQIDVRPESLHEVRDEMKICEIRIGDGVEVVGTDSDDDVSIRGESFEVLRASQEHVEPVGVIARHHASRAAFAR
jgi:hypothetical protein